MAYLTVDQYVETFGEPETIRITDTDQAGTVDVAKVSNAIQEASDFADSYLAARYRLPFAGDVPQILKGIIEALAREILHKTRVTAQVKEAADAARSQLKDLAAGRAVLMIGGDTDDVPEINPTSNPASSMDRRSRVFGDDVMGDYTSMGYGCGWRSGPLG